MCHAEVFADRFSLGVKVDTDDHIGAHQSQTLQNIEADTAESKHYTVRTGLYFGRVDDRADTRSDPTADVTHFVERRVSRILPVRSPAPRCGSRKWTFPCSGRFCRHRC